MSYIYRNETWLFYFIFCKKPYVEDMTSAHLRRCHHVFRHRRRQTTAIRWATAKRKVAVMWFYLESVFYLLSSVSLCCFIVFISFSTTSIVWKNISSLYAYLLASVEIKWKSLLINKILRFSVWKFEYEIGMWNPS